MRLGSKKIVFACAISLVLSFNIGTGNSAEFNGSLKEVTITDKAGENKPPIASFTYTVNGDSVLFDATSSNDLDGSIVVYKWDFGDGTFGEGASVSHQYQDLTNRSVTLTLVDNSQGISILQQPLQFQEPVNIKVNFQPSNVPVPEGFIADSGGHFDVAKGFGWVKGPSSYGTRDRNNEKSPTQAYDTMIHVNPSSQWEAEVPNGTYEVTVCSGDPSFPGGMQNVQVEGNEAIKNTALSNGVQWIEKTVSVTVSDGKLTITFAGNSDIVRLCWISISSMN